MDSKLACLNIRSSGFSSKSAEARKASCQALLWCDRDCVFWLKVNH